ncbi:Probable N-acetylglucosaminyl-phosphatidylinositol de-N-acetylase [Linum grandiflorum]
MGVLFIVVSLIVLWIASLCKILKTPNSQSKSTFMREVFPVSGDVPHKKSVLLVIAHPDDESMFFSPTINYLISRGHNVYLLCLSIGNADGRGNTRKDELYQACLVLKVPVQQVKILDHPDLQDGFGLVWDHGLLSKIIQGEVSNHHIDTVITFDSHGVSGHCNHRDVYYGVIKLLQDSSERHIEAWELVSSGILRKYSGPVDIWLSMLLAMKSGSRTTCCLLNEQPWKSFNAMAAHSSQWVWFRKLFVSFSSYTYVNSLGKIN